MSLSRRGFFRGLFGAGVVAALAPVVKALVVPIKMKYRQPGISTAVFDIASIQTDTGMVFEPKEYYASVYAGNTRYFREIGELMAAEKES